MVKVIITDENRLLQQQEFSMYREIEVPAIFSRIDVRLVSRETAK